MATGRFRVQDSLVDKIVSRKKNFFLFFLFPFSLSFSLPLFLSWVFVLGRLSIKLRGATRAIHNCFLRIRNIIVLGTEGYALYKHTYMYFI